MISVRRKLDGTYIMAVSGVVPNSWLGVPFPDLDSMPPPIREAVMLLDAALCGDEVRVFGVGSLYVGKKGGRRYSIVHGGL